MLRNSGRRQRIQEFSWIMYCLLSIHDCVNWVIGLWWSFKFWKNKIFISSICSLVGDSIAQGWPTCGSLRDYLWFSIHLPEFPFHFCVIIFFKNHYRSVCVSKCILNYWHQIWKTKCNVVTNFISVQVRNDMTYCHQLFTKF